MSTSQLPLTLRFKEHTAAEPWGAVAQVSLPSPTGMYGNRPTASIAATRNGYEGLMTADGHKVTMPLYWEIEALDHDLYLCASKNGDKVIVNGKGKVVRQS